MKGPTDLAEAMLQLDAGSKVIAQQEDELKRLRADAGGVVYALDCSIQLLDMLIAFLPDGTPLHPQIGGAKMRLDEAMANLHLPVDPSADPALKICVAELTASNEHRTKLTHALNSALALMDAMLIELSHSNRVLPMVLVVGKKQLDDTVKKLLSE